MRLFKCDSKVVDMVIVELPKSHWRALPPSKLQTILTLASIVIVAVLWSLT